MFNNYLECFFDPNKSVINGYRSCKVEKKNQYLKDISSSPVSSLTSPSVSTPAQHLEPILILSRINSILTF